MTTPYHARFFAHELSRQGGEGVERLAQSLFDACVDLNPHQIEAALFAMRSPISKGVLLADEVGLGKTIEAGLAICQHWAERRRRILVITPASIRKQWALELEDKFHLPSIVLDAKTCRQIAGDGNPSPFVQDRIVICSMHFASSRATEIKPVQWDLVVIDEAHKLRNAYRQSNKIGQNIRWALEDRRKVLVTATPLQNSLLELYGLSYIIDEYLFGDLPSYRTRYVNAGGNLDELRSRLKSFCTRTLRNQVVEYIQYTERRLITRPFEPTDHEYKLYEAVSDFLKRDDTYALPYRQRHLTALIVRKLLASSSRALAGTLEVMRDRLVALRDDAKADLSLVERIIEDEEIEGELLDEFLNGDEDEAEGQSNLVTEEPDKIDRQKLNAEIEELTRYIQWANSIGVDTKTRALLTAVEIGFSEMERIGAARRVVVFTESRRTQQFLRDFLEANGCAGRVILFNGTNSDAVAQAKSFGAPDPEQTEPVKKAKAALAAAKDTSRAETEVYDHLYRFFERYYDAGDFMSRRYLSRETSSKAAAYAVPYDGSEVYLHWANKDQYYIKTAEYFTNFTFDPAQAPEVRQAEGLFTAPNQPLRVHFRIVAATEGEHGNIKAGNGAKRFFILHKDDPISVESGDLVVRFEYRPDPEKSGQDKTWQAKRNEEAVAGILEVLGVLNDARAKEYLAILKTPAPTEKRADRPLLAKYIAQYTARNTMDYFIHKDLGGFLRRELDFYIKNEVMRLDDIEAADAPKAEQYLAQVKVLRQIADKLIDFLAQLENFQKRLWLKKKFIVETNYCVTLDRVPEELYPDIAANDAQREEWVRLFAIDEIKVETLGQVAYSEPLTVGFLKANPHLVLDTKLFPETFKITLLAVVEDIDEQTDGILASSENFQALALLGAEYQSRVQCAYSDPPYNTSDETFVYKNEYKHSSWLSMLRDRLFLVRRLLEDKGAAIVAIDDMELYRLKLTMDEVFGENNGLGTVVVQSNPRGRGINSYFATCHDYYLYYGDEAGLVQIVDQPLSDEQAGGYRHADDTSEFRLLPFRRSGGLSTPDERPNSEFSIYYSRTKRQIIGVGGPRTEAYPAAYRPGSVLVRTESDTIKELSVKDFEKVTAGDDVAEIMPVDSDGRRRVWRWSHREKIMACVIAGDFVVIQNGSEYTVQLKDRIKEGRKPKTIWSDSKYDASSHGTNLLSDMLGERRSFGYPKSLFSTHDAVHAIVGASERALVLDPFGGSGTTGHAVINLNREDDGNRRYILVEMGDYFDTVLKPRIQKVVYSKDWKDGKPVSRDSGISHMFKYIRLESYEDCLNNLELKDDAERERIVAGSASLREDYMLHYMLDVETKGSVSLLNIDKFADPTAYKLKVKKPGSDEYEWKNVDLLETFNYLVGLRVEHIAAPQAFRAEFDREKDPDLPKGQLGRLMVKGRLKQDPNGPWWFRKVEGWVPKNPQTPNDGRREKVLIVWRKLTGDIEQDNLVLDEWFRKYQINPRESYDYDTIYVNGSNNLPNLKLENENWRVRLIEEDFHRLMWDVEDV